MVDLSVTKQRLADWGFETVVVCADQGQDDRLREFLSKDYPNFLPAANSSKGTWKRQTYKGVTLYGLRNDWTLDITAALTIMHDGAKISLVRAAPITSFEVQRVGILLAFDADRFRFNTKQANDVPRHRVDEVRDWVSEREGTFHWFERTAHRNADPAYAVFCVGEDAAMEFRLRWDVIPSGAGAA